MQFLYLNFYAVHFVHVLYTYQCKLSQKFPLIKFNPLAYTAFGSFMFQSTDISTQYQLL